MYSYSSYAKMAQTYEIYEKFKHWRKSSIILFLLNRPEIYWRQFSKRKLICEVNHLPLRTSGRGEKSRNI